MLQGIDYSFGRPGGAAISAAGKRFAMRYVAYPGDQGKGLRLVEAADLLSYRIAIGLVFESTAGRMFGGYPAGRADAGLCETADLALNRVARPTYFACDVDTVPAQLAYVDDYLAGAASVLGAERVGVYGEFDVVEHCAAVGSARWFWQTYAWSGDGHGGTRWSSHAHVRQYLNGQTLNGAPVDLDDAIDGDFGQWPAPEEAMTNDDILAVFGSTESDPAVRLSNAKARYQTALAGVPIPGEPLAHLSPRDLAAQAIAEIRGHVASPPPGADVDKLIAEIGRRLTSGLP